MRGWTKIALFALFALTFLSPPLNAEEKPQFSPEERAFLIDQFTDRFNSFYLTQVFEDQRLNKLDVIAERNVNNQETHRDYQDFHSPYSLFLAQRFEKKWRKTLVQASKKFEVDPEAVVAILLVETGFGNVLGRYPVIGVFSSILVERETAKDRYPIDLSLSESEQYYLNKLDRKAKWAKEELAALLELSQKNQKSPYHYKGSYAGAFGLPQFLPSSYLKWGYDSDKSGSVNLFRFPDSIYSTANYLKSHGWVKGLENQANHEAVYHYNRSQPYVETVLKIAQKLRNKRGGLSASVALEMDESVVKPPASGI